MLFRSIGFTKALEFTSFTKKVAGELDADSTAIDPIPVEVKFWPPEGGEAAALPPPRFAAKKAEPAAEAPATSAATAPTGAEAALLAIPVTHADYETVTTLDQLKAWAQAAYEKGYIALDTETDSLDSIDRKSTRLNSSHIPLSRMPSSA